MALIELRVDADETMRWLGDLRANLWPKVMRESAKEIARESLREFRRTTTTWKHKPVFEALTETTRDEITVLVGTDDAIYRYVDEGTRAHEIKPKGNYPLRFHSKYAAKTTPNVINSHGGGPSGPVVYARRVWHPGTKPRNFGNIIQRIMDKKAADIFDRQVDRIIRR